MHAHARCSLHLAPLPAPGACRNYQALEGFVSGTIRRMAGQHGADGSQSSDDESGSDTSTPDTAEEPDSEAAQEEGAGEAHSGPVCGPVGMLEGEVVHAC